MPSRAILALRSRTRPRGATARDTERGRDAVTWSLLPAACIVACIAVRTAIALAAAVSCAGEGKTGFPRPHSTSRPFMISFPALAFLEKSSRS